MAAPSGSFRATLCMFRCSAGAGAGASGKFCSKMPRTHRISSLFVFSALPRIWTCAFAIQANFGNKLDNILNINDIMRHNAREQQHMSCTCEALRPCALRSLHGTNIKRHILDCQSKLDRSSQQRMHEPRPEHRTVPPQDRRGIPGYRSERLSRRNVRMLEPI